MVYVVLGVQQDIIILKILPESKRNELKCSLKITVIFLSIIVKWQVPTLSILFVIQKKATVRDGPCMVHDSSKKNEKHERMQ